jgi:transcriptional regulator with XRE-family HTH domain
MDAYRTALSAYLEPKDRTQEGLAAAIGCKQPTINRYVNGERFPDAATARLIDEATDGAVPFETWRSVAAEKFLGGDTAPAEAA